MNRNNNNVHPFIGFNAAKLVSKHPTSLHQRYCICDSCDIISVHQSAYGKEDRLNKSIEIPLLVSAGAYA